MSDFWGQIKVLFSRIFSRGKQSVETLAESLDRQAAVQRLSAQIRALNRERRDLILSIGKKVYSLHVRGKVRNRDVLADCKQIDDLRVRIEQLYQEIEEIRRRGLVEEEQVLEDETILAEEEEIPSPAAPAAEALAEPEPERGPQPERAPAPPEPETDTEPPEDS